MFDTARPMRVVYRLDDLAAHVEDDAISAARALVGSAPRAPAAPAVPQQSRPTPPSRASSHISEMRLCMRGSSPYHVLQPGDRHTALDLTTLGGKHLGPAVPHPHPSLRAASSLPVVAVHEAT